MMEVKRKKKERSGKVEGGMSTKRETCLVSGWLF